jgi:hypothetical protein
MKKPLKYFGIGWIVLAGAVAINIAVKRLGVTIWSDYITAIGAQGFSQATLALNAVDIAFLLLFYPLLLGLLVYPFLRNQRR